jgi:hypothetical protein
MLLIYIYVYAYGGHPGGAADPGTPAGAALQVQATGGHTCLRYGRGVVRKGPHQEGREDVCINKYSHWLWPLANDRSRCFMTATPERVDI